MKKAIDSIQPATGASGRDAKIVRTSVIGIVANVLLAAFKAFVGLASHSVAIVMDAVNNLSDAASSVITIVGTRLAGKEADRKHPFGYGRVEYLSAMVISLLVLYAGVTAFTESVKKILQPETPDYSALSLVIVAVAVAVKLLLGGYVKRVGEAVRSDSLVNSGQDATLDAVISAATLAAAGIYLLFHISLEAWLGAGIALVIVRSGVGMLRETLSKILGERADAELARAIRQTVTAPAEVSGAYDLVLHNYGPDAWQGSVHIEVPDTLSAGQLDRLLRQITMDVYEKHNVILTAVGVYSVNTKDPAAIRARERVRALVTAHPAVLQMHGFYLDEAEKTLRFDLVLSLDERNRAAVWQELREQVQAAFPDYRLEMTMDTDFSEA